MSMQSALNAEVAYRQELVAKYFRPWRRVGVERLASRGVTRVADGRRGLTER